jgi:hypothetical protein
MMARLQFLLLCSSFWIALGGILPTQASEIQKIPPAVLDLSISKNQALDLTPEHPMLEFSLEESNEAIALFGCDCPAHLGRLRQIKGSQLDINSEEIF